MKELFTSGDVLQKSGEIARPRLNAVSIGRQKGIYTYNFLATMIYTVTDFFTIFLSILFSYKLYRFLADA